MNKNLVLELKPDAEDAAKRWDAYWQNEMLDRPLLLICAPKEGYQFKSGVTYRDKLFGDAKEIVARSLHNISGMIYGAEAMPAFWGAVSSDEAASLCGADIIFSDGIDDTTWASHPVKNWDDWLPLKINEQSLAFQRIQEIYQLAAVAMENKGLMFHLDSHFNMDLLMGLRGSEQLCLDLYDEPELVEKALHQTLPIFERCWNLVKELADMDNRGYWFDGFSRDPLYMQACDFSALMSPEMFSNLVVPVMEEEIRIIGCKTIYHWDGPDALRHLDALMGIKDLHTVSYVPSPFRNHVEQLEIYKKVQARGKGVTVSGTDDEIKYMHKELNPALTIFRINAKDEQEIENWIKWFVRNS